ncbi:unnamed protein product [Diatraea saccharalis]|uniref:Uncharacterized protein n=1 Tax=Diatraea saccharalis TaxID=40085 RepID=A0A9N9WCJ8_9NEOP|nr:unnamed protein product [Diatraea saccharalis]
MAQASGDYSCRYQFECKGQHDGDRLAKIKDRYTAEQIQTRPTPDLSILERQIGMERYDPLVTSRNEKKHYYPNYGYEPYWADGEFMIKHPDYDLKPGQSTTKMPLVCGEECGYIFLRVRHLCASKSTIYWLPYCYGTSCYGHIVPDLTKEYRDFNSYCELLNANCRLSPTEHISTIQAINADVAS